MNLLVGGAATRKYAPWEITRGWKSVFAHLVCPCQTKQVSASCRQYKSTFADINTEDLVQRSGNRTTVRVVVGPVT